MMEESCEEQPEMVSHEEAVLAEREATQLTGGPHTVPGLAAPSPLPAFLSTPSTPVVAKTLQEAATSSKSSVHSKDSNLDSPSTSAQKAHSPSTSSHKAPGPLDIPHASDQFSDMSLDQASIVATRGSDSLFSWISGNSFMNKVMETTKNSLDLVITTLDPGMKDAMNSGEAIEIVVTSSKENKIAPIREAFQNTFLRVSVTGVDSKATAAAQPVGYPAGVKGAEERISNLRKSGSLRDGQIIVSIEGFIAEILPEKWYEMSCLILKDTANGIDLQTFSQPTFIPSEYVMTAQDDTPSNYPLRWSGLAKTIGEVIEKANPHIGHADWQLVLSGVSRKESLTLAAQSLAHMYKSKLPSSFVS